MKKTQNIFFFAILLITCYGCSDRSDSVGVDVYHSFTLNGHNYGLRDTINLAYDVSWNTTLGSSNLLSFNLPYIKPGETTVYTSMIFYIENPILGDNVANLTWLSDPYSYREESNFRINLTHLASSPGDYYQGTFHGTIECMDFSTLNSNYYASSGDFKVYLEE
jgi:hypothetical protein